MKLNFNSISILIKIVCTKMQFCEILHGIVLHLYKNGGILFKSFLSRIYNFYSFYWINSEVVCIRKEKFTYIDLRCSNVCMSCVGYCFFQYFGWNTHTHTVWILERTKTRHTMSGFWKSAKKTVIGKTKFILIFRALWQNCCLSWISKDF